MGGDQGQWGQHYNIFQCYSSKQLDPASKYAFRRRDFGPIKLAFWYSGSWTNKLGRLKESDLRAADDTTNTAAYPNVLPVRFLLSCSTLWGSDVALDGQRYYWGFGNTWGNFGKTHGPINAIRRLG